MPLVSANYSAPVKPKDSGNKDQRRTDKRRNCIGKRNCLLIGCLTSQQHASVSQGRICTVNFRAATLREKLQIQLSTSPSHSILTPGWPVPVLTLYRQAPGRVATGVPIFKSLVWLDLKKIPSKLDSNPGSSAPEADALTTRSARRWKEEHRDWLCAQWTRTLPCATRPSSTCAGRGEVVLGQNPFQAHFFFCVPSSISEVYHF